MFELSTEQIAIISKDVENEGINFSHLQYDLIDHICCDIEMFLNQGISFDEAYSQVKKKFDIKGLRQIQQDTLMLIDKNYRIMKKSMKMIGALALALMAFGALFKIGHWPGASFLLSVGFFFTTLVFFPTLLYIVYKEVNQKKHAVLFIIAFISGFLFMDGVLFKIMHWPGAQIMLFSGLGLLAFLLLPLIIILGTKTSKIHKTLFALGLLAFMLFNTGLIFKIQHWPGASILLTIGSLALVLGLVPMYYKLEVAKSEKPRIYFIFGIIALTYFIVFGFLLSLKSNHSVLLDFNYQDKSFRTSAEYFTNQNTQLIKNIDADKALKLVEQADVVCNYINNVKIMIVQHNNEITKDEAVKLYRSNTLITGNETSYLLAKTNINSPLPTLKSEIEIFKHLYEVLYKDSLNQKPLINKLLNTKEGLMAKQNYPVDWEEYYFGEIQPAAALSTLSLWEYNTRLIENKVLSALATNLNKN